MLIFKIKNNYRQKLFINKIKNKMMIGSLKKKRMKIMIMNFRMKIMKIQKSIKWKINEKRRQKNSKIFIKLIY